MNHSAAELWAFLPQGYLLTILIETPILLLGLSSSHSFGRRLVAGCWLTACTYPIVVLILPFLVADRWGRVAYLVTAETFAPIAECLLFRAAVPIPASRTDAFRDLVAIIVANVMSFTAGFYIFG